MKESLFEVLRAEGLTHLEIHYDWKTDRARLYAGREWDSDIRWSGYNRSFTQWSLLTGNAVYRNDAGTRELFARHGLSGYLEQVIELMRKGRHILLDCYYWAERDIRFVNSIHSDRKGLNNRRSALVMGGIRRHEPEEEELEVLIDGMNLGRGMSFKNVAARIPMGGCKITVQMPPVDLEDLDQVGFLAYANDRTRNTTGPDMNFPTELADVMKEHFSLQITGGPAGPLGATGTPTAHGTYMAVKEGARFLWGSDSLEGKRIAVQGLGAVGRHLAEDYLREGAELIVCDVDGEALKRLQTDHPDAVIAAVAPEEIYEVEADIFSPCAVGGIITRERIPRLRFAMIMGPANNQLKASSQEEECELARELDRAGILFQVAWWHNIAGVMTGYEEYIHQDEASMERLMSKVGALCTEQTRENLARAREEGVTPTEMAYRSVEREIYG